MLADNIYLFIIDWDINIKMSLIKAFRRIGKHSEDFIVNIRFIACEVLVTEECTISLTFKRGPQRDETIRKKVSQSQNGKPVKVEFNQTFSRTSGFYKGDN